MELYNLEEKNSFLISQKALIIKNGKVLALRAQLPPYTGKNLWDLPGGLIEYGENMERGLKREVKEETGLTISNTKLKSIFDKQHANFKFKNGKTKDVHIFILVYTCTVLSGKVSLSYEHDKFKWVTKKELAELKFYNKKEIDWYLKQL